MLQSSLGAFSAQDQTRESVSLLGEVTQNGVSHELWRVFANNYEVVRLSLDQMPGFVFVPGNCGVESRILKNLLKRKEDALVQI
ncbi:MAG TPA: hypothetical protein VEI01_20390 [Terriglobales bacterium]|nr:hypothetical protein [Terriglobales bacterium]